MVSLFYTKSTRTLRPNAEFRGRLFHVSRVSRVSQDDGGVKERYLTLFEQAPIGVFVFDGALTITECNESLARILSSTRARLVGLDMKRLRDQNVVPSLRAAIDGKSAYYEGPYLATTSDAAVVVALRTAPLRDHAGAVIGGLGVVEDITERTRAAQQVKESEERFRRLIERAPDAIAVVAQDQRIAYANDELASALRRERGALVGAGVLGFVDAPEDRAALLRCLTESEPRRPPIEVRFTTPEGDRIHFEVTTMPIDHDGRPATLLFGRDVTERTRLQARLMQADRMVAMGTLAAGVAHEINNPLAYLSANLELLAKRKLPEVRQKLVDAADADPRIDPEITESLARCGEMLEIAREGAARVKDIVRDLKTFSRDDERRAAVDVRRVLDACVNIACNDLRQRATVVREYDEVPTVHANESRLGQVFLNLLLNAAQSIAPGRAKENRIVLGVRAEDGHVRVTVSDTGQGIPPEAQAHVFEPFYTTKPAGVGTGLGLFICKGILGSLGGDIAIASSSPSGTTFEVRLPVHDLAPEAAPEHAHAHAPLAGKPRVLFVDDEIALGDAVRAALDDEFVVDVEGSGNRAIARLARGESYAAIVCDVMMPEVSGMEVYATVTKQRPELARSFVFVTGAAFSPPTRDFLATIPNTKLEKPFDMHALRDALFAITSRGAHAAS
jgi:PAS domain S-box-containing protein